MTTEWAIQEKTFIDGEFDRIQTGHGFPERKYTREEVERYVKSANERYNTEWTRVVSREVTDWAPVEEPCGCRVCVNNYANALEAQGRGLEALTARTGSFIMCPDCGNKRCPKATFHGHECTKSNAPGQQGSLYGFPHEKGTCTGCDEFWEDRSE